MNSYYVYALKDPRTSPAKPFYIGKGTGTRAWDHTTRDDNTRKGRRVASIQNGGHEVITTVLVADLSEIQAMKLEAELISAFGTEETGGLLTNAVVPTGVLSKAKKEIVIPSGVQERAQLGLSMLKESVLELAKSNPKGVTNSDVTKSLGLQSD